MEKPPQEDNLYKLSQERKAYRDVLKDEDIPDIILDEAKKGLDETYKDEKDKKEGWFGRTKERFLKDKEKAEAEKGIDEDAILESLGEDTPKFREISALSDKFSDISEFEMKRLRDVKTDPHANKAHERLLQLAKKEKEELTQKLDDIERANPTLYHTHSLVEYKRGLHSEGHIAHTPSVDKAINEIGTRMIGGRPMFLHGPTGTGKTSLAKYAAEHFTGEKAEMVYCNPQTRESNIWGKTGIKPTEGGGIETVDVYGPLARAMQSGKTVIFDEFTALPREQMVFIKGILNAKVGDTVNVMGNGTVEIRTGFQMIFTANLKSEKNPERQELPPEIAREFEQNNLEVSYTQKEEAYDIILARLSNPDGSIDMSFHDLNITLPKFLEAMEEVQTAYTDKTNDNTAKLTGTMDASGKRPGLKKLVFTQGTVEAICDAWLTEKQINVKHKSFAEFLDERLKTALTFKEYPETDRTLAAKILASKGLLRTVTPKDLDLPESTFSFDAAKKQRGDKNSITELGQTSSKEVHLSLKEVADLDPFHTRKQTAIDTARSFLTPEEQEEKTTNNPESNETFPDMDAFLLDTYKGWNVNQTRLDAIKFSPELISPQNLDYLAKKADIDVSKYGEYTMNPDTADIDWDTVPQDKIKVITLPADMNGKKLDEIASYITATYGSKYKTPGLDYYKYICEHPDKAPDSLKDGNYYFMFGSLFRNSDGNWNVPYVLGDASGFYRIGYWLGRDWLGNYRVVLLET